MQSDLYGNLSFPPMRKVEQDRITGKEGPLRAGFSVLLLALGLSVASCGFDSPAPALSYGLSQESLSAIEEAGSDGDFVERVVWAELERLFGTPAVPVMPIPLGGSEHAQDLATAAALYRKECRHCHGVEGGGDGPTGSYMRPKPRDFRLGVFKWTMLEYGSAPRHEDLVRVLVEGVPGTSMASFSKLDSEQLAGLADYVRLLSTRGELERLLVSDAIDDGELDSERAAESFQIVQDRWLHAQDAVVALSSPVPAATAERLKRGRELFLGAGECVSCHGEEGKGDGVSIWEKDSDGERVRKLDDWGQPSKPRNLKRGNFRGGGRPVDIYRRIKCGISGTIMPAASKLLTDDDLWALALYVLAMSGEPSATIRIEGR